MKQRGFTLLELMVTIAVLAIVVSLAAPSFRETIAANRARAASDALVSALSLARLEAVKRGKYVSTCLSVDGSSCDGTDPTQHSLIVFLDGATSATATTFTVTELIRRFDAMPSQVTLSVSPTTVTGVRFSSMGALANVTQNITFTLKPSTCVTNSARQVVVTLAGHVATNKTGC